MTGFRVGDKKGFFWAGCVLKSNEIEFVRAHDGLTDQQIDSNLEKYKPNMCGIDLKGEVLNVAMDKQQNRFILFLVKLKTFDTAEEDKTIGVKD